jgi:hypothetical protein
MGLCDFCKDGLFGGMDGWEGWNGMAFFADRLCVRGERFLPVALSAFYLFEK